MYETTPSSEPSSSRLLSLFHRSISFHPSQFPSHHFSLKTETKNEKMEEIVSSCLAPSILSFHLLSSPLFPFLSSSPLPRSLALPISSPPLLSSSFPSYVILSSPVFSSPPLLFPPLLSCLLVSSPLLSSSSLTFFSRPLSSFSISSSPLIPLLLSAPRWLTHYEQSTDE